MIKIYLICYIFHLNNAKLPIVEMAIPEEISPCLAQTVRKFYIENITLVIYSKVKIFAQLNSLQNPIYILNGFETGLKYLGNNYVFYDRHPSSLLSGLEIFQKSKLWDDNKSPRGKFLVIIRDNFDERVVFQHFWKFDIFNVILGKMLPNNVAFYTSNPYTTENRCGSFPEKIVNWSCTEMKLFESNFSDLSKCHISASVVFNFFPYAEVPLSGKRSIYIEPLEIISKKTNLKIQYFTFDEKEIFDYLKVGVINTTVNYINSGYRDIFVATQGLFKYYYDYLELTDTFHYDKQIWIILKPGLMNHTKIIQYIFSLEIWIFTLINLLFITILFWFHSKRKYNFLYYFLSFYNTTLGTCFPIKVNKLVLRVILLIYMFYVLIITNSFRARFSSILTKPIQDSGVRNVEEMIHSNIMPILSNQKRLFVKAMNDSLAEKLFAKSIPLTTEIEQNKFMYLKKNPQSAVTIYKSALEIEDKSVVNALGDDFLLPMKASYALKKGHPLIPLFNNYGKRIWEAGLYQNWILDWNYIDYEKEADNQLIVLTFEHVKVAFVILIYGYSISVCMFVSEILFSRFLTQTIRKRK